MVDITAISVSLSKLLSKQLTGDMYYFQVLLFQYKAVNKFNMRLINKYMGVGGKKGDEMLTF